MCKPELDESPLRLVKIDGKWYDIGDFAPKHPGGEDLLRRHAGTDITYLFYSNHFHSHASKLKSLNCFEDLPNDCDDSKSSAASANTTPTDLINGSPHSSLYRELQAKVHSHLKKEKIEWRHKFSYQTYVLRTTCLAAVWGIKANGLANGSAFGSALIYATAIVYGFLISRQAWTQTHNAVHNPGPIPNGVRLLMKFDYACNANAWMLEHQAHHAYTNLEDHDPDLVFFVPLFSYKAIAKAGGSCTKAILAMCSYPFIIMVSNSKNVQHTLRHSFKWCSCNSKFFRTFK